MKYAQRKKARRFDVNKLEDPVIKKSFKDNIKNVLQNNQIPLQDTVDREW